MACGCKKIGQQTPKRLPHLCLVYRAVSPGEALIRICHGITAVYNSDIPARFSETNWLQELSVKHDGKEQKGTVALISTPLTEVGVIDETSLHTLLDYDLDNGCDGFEVNAAISKDYPHTLKREDPGWINYQRPNGQPGPLIAGVPALGTRYAVIHCQMIQEAWVDVILTFNPIFRALNPTPPRYSPKPTPNCLHLCRPTKSTRPQALQRQVNFLV